MNYKVIKEGPITSDIVLTDDEPDDYEVFKTFAKAKADLINHIKSGALNWEISLKWARRLKKDQVD